MDSWCLHQALSIETETWGGQGFPERTYTNKHLTAHIFRFNQLWFPGMSRYLHASTVWFDHCVSMVVIHVNCWDQYLSCKKYSDAPQEPIQITTTNIKCKSSGCHVTDQHKVEHKSEEKRKLWISLKNVPCICFQPLYLGSPKKRSNATNCFQKSPYYKIQFICSIQSLYIYSCSMNKFVV